MFLRAEDLSARDEYSDTDPYGVKDNLTSSFHDNRVRTTVDLLRSALHSGATTPRLLDLACGEGHITAAIHSAYPDAEVSALDCSLSAIATATRTYRDIDFVVADAYEPPYAPQYFDAVVCNNIWEHVPDPMRLLEGVKRVLKSDGAIVISTPSRYKLTNLLRVLLGKEVTFQSQLHVTEYSVGQVIEQLRFGSFTVVRIVGDRVGRERAGVKGLVLHFLLAPAISIFLRAVKSHHSLAQTVFFLAKKNCDNGGASQE